MKKNDFKIGQDFYTSSGTWRCTDIGTRTICAIQLNQTDSNNYKGPPYSIAEHVFDEYDLEGCSLDACEFEEDIGEIGENSDELLKNQQYLTKQKKFIEIYDAFWFVSGAGYGENSAIMDKNTGQSYFQSDYCDMDEMEQLADEDFDPAIHISIPHKNDLDLGRNLVFKFVEQFMTDDYEKVAQIFRKKGAYSRYKYLLDSRGMLEQWYDFENQSEQFALLEWCKENEIDLIDKT